MSLLELMIAMAVLTVGMLGAMVLIIIGMESNSRNKTDNTATVLDQEILEMFATLKNYPKTGNVIIYDCALSGASANQHQALLVQAAGPSGNGATLYTTLTAPAGYNAGDIDWSQPTPTLATSTTQGYAMQYQTCSGDIYEVRWNIMEVSPNPSSRISLLTVSSRETVAKGSTLGMFFAPPGTLRTLIEN